MNVPLGVLRAPAFARRLLQDPRRSRRDGAGPASRSRARPVRRRVDARRAAALLAHRLQHPLEPSAERASTADGAREEVLARAVVVLGVFELRQLARRPRSCVAREVFDTAARRQHLSRADGSEAVGRLGDRLPAQRRRQGRRRRIAASRESGVDDRANPRRQQVLVRGQRPVTFHGEVPPDRCPAPGELAHDVGLQASGGEQRRLHGDRYALITPARCRRRRRSPCRRSTPARRARRAPPRRARPERAEASRRSRPRRSSSAAARLKDSTSSVP